MPHEKLKKIHVSKPDESIDLPSRSSYPPSFDVTEAQVPEIKKWKVGENYRMIIEVKQTSAQKSSVTDSNQLTAGFKIVAYKVIPNEGKHINDMDDGEFGDEQGRQLSKS